jgi:steroid delta-isomerase-like uncharacterized protein
MTGEEAIAVVRHCVELYNKGDLSTIYESMFSPDFTFYIVNVAKTLTRDETFSLDKRFLVAFPDFQFTIEDAVSDGNKVAIISRYRMTHKGEWMGAPATDKQIDVTLTHFWTVVDGRITKLDGMMDDLSFQRQLGLIPSPGQQ